MDNINFNLFFITLLLFYLSLYHLSYIIKSGICIDIYAFKFANLIMLRKDCKRSAHSSIQNSQAKELEMEINDH